MVVNDTFQSNLNPILQAIFNDSNKSTTNLCRPDLTDNEKVLVALIRSSGCVVSLRILQKNSCKSLNMDMLKGK